MNKKYMFRTKEVVDENWDCLHKPECQMDDADDAIAECCGFTYCADRKYGERNMWKAVADIFKPVARSITLECDTGMITVRYDKDKIHDYLKALLIRLGSSVTIANIHDDYRCVYSIEGWNDIKTCKGFIYDNLSACTPFDSYMAFLLWCKNTSADTFDMVFEVNETEIPG